jgi:transcriptional regulator with XRE-family HTH domain
MGYGGKWQERERARELRAQSWTLQEIADELGVAKGSVSVWVRDVEFTPKPRNRGHPAGPKHPMRLRREAELARCAEEAREWIAGLSERDLSMFVLGLYAGEGAKTGGTLAMANTNPRYLLIFVTWLRRTFDVDESRLRVHLYLHEGLDLDAAVAFWSDLLGIPPEQFTKPYRAAADPSIRRAKHVYGCPAVRYASTSVKRRVMALIEALASNFAIPG